MMPQPTETLSKVLMVQHWLELSESEGFSSARLVNNHFYNEFCKDLDPFYWSEINGSPISIVDTNLNLEIELPGAMSFLGDSLEISKNIRHLHILDWDLKRNSKEQDLLRTIGHPFIKWVDHFLKEFALLPHKEVLKFLNMNYLVLLNIKEIVEGNPPADGILQHDYEVVHKVWMKAQEF